MKEPKSTSAYPQVTFFVESREQADLAIQNDDLLSRGDYLQGVIGSDEVVDAIRSISGRVSVAVNRREMDQDLALMDLLRHYNQKGIPIDLWANLEDSDGYWIHAGNMVEARATILGLINRLEAKNVRIDRIGLDLEPPIQFLSPRIDLGRYVQTAPWAYSQPKATEQLGYFIDELLETSPYGVDTYEIPLLGDIPIVRRMLGIPKVPAIRSPRFRRVGMVYSSVKPPVIPAGPFIEHYSKGKGRIPALGIVSASDQNPGRNINFKRLLTDEELNRDVKKAHEVSPNELYVFALNGLRMVERVRSAIGQALTSK